MNVQHEADGPVLTSLIEAWQLSTRLGPDALMHQVAASVARTARADRVSFMLLDQEKQELIVRAAVGLAPEAIGARVGVGLPIAGWVALNGRALLLPKGSEPANGSEPPAPIRRAMTRREIGSSLSVPLRAEGRVVGVLNVTRLSGQPFTSRDLRSVSTLGEQIGPCIETAQRNADTKERRALAATILDEVPTGLLVVDRALRVVSANRSLLRMMGRDVSQTIGRDLETVLPGARKGDLAQHMRDALRDGRQVEGEKIVQRERGLPARVYACRIHPLEAREGMERAVVLLEDVTDRERLATGAARAIGPAWPAALGSLAPAIAHELRNPLASALACAQLLLEHPVEERDRADGLLRIRASIQRAVAIVEGLLRMATSSEKPTESINVNDLLSETQVLVDDRLTGQNVRFTLDLAAELPSVQGDALLLQQVFTNVVLNASAAMGGGGELAVRTSVRGGTVEIRFADTGCGIPPEHLARIFEPFFTTRAPQGTGLGLSVSRTIVERHKGTIEVRSEVGSGTTVIIGLPAAPLAMSAA